MITIEAFHKFIRTTNEALEHQGGADHLQWDPMDHDHLEGDEDE